MLFEQAGYFQIECHVLLIETALLLSKGCGRAFGFSLTSGLGRNKEADGCEAQEGHHCCGPIFVAPETMPPINSLKVFIHFSSNSDEAFVSFGPNRNLPSSDSTRTSNNDMMMSYSTSGSGGSGFG